MVSEIRKLGDSVFPTIILNVPLVCSSEKFSRAVPLKFPMGPLLFDCLGSKNHLAGEYIFDVKLIWDFSILRHQNRNFYCIRLVTKLIYPNDGLGEEGSDKNNRNYHNLESKSHYKLSIDIA
jgi:hypothetical protein